MGASQDILDEMQEAITKAIAKQKKQHDRMTLLRKNASVASSHYSQQAVETKINGLMQHKIQLKEQKTLADRTRDTAKQNAKSMYDLAA